ncbi:hypothetical protein SPRG_02991 [Saprolegnia parasitica CBS 223.65]|uniref:Uncharacterized protein n=1 Tax=Saprolegnia parasitica (strain CBS 223.65) TaxID=695850 RepID=A0A067CP82_SAPPC|nr:hypothetical protein SPRG_02991 [Saprolegnia parasitica CBS 223.65]KDO32514.1 hypothetical protein SPRG_02991 [Saprolegnia parasitica CBS 223.65]|eukprot:XP_012196963.1 hypothetical protein SPRG_02991 [Saprolegnia parasitica CBS 223.65]
MTAKRPSPAPASVLDVADVVVTIVQCTPSPTDVTSFLQALPPATLTPPLAALRQFLSSLEPSMASYVWPRPNLCDANDTLLVAAMSIFNSVCIGGYSPRRHSSSGEAIYTRLRGTPVPDRVRFDKAFCRFVANWTAKVTHVELLESPSVDHREACYSMLRQCTSLQHAHLPCETPLLEAITTPAHRVSELNLSFNKRWLASGYARRLALASFTTPDARLALALSSSTLSGLALDVSPGALQSLIENGVHLRHLKELNLNAGVRSAKGFRQLAPVLDLPMIEQLTLTSKRDGAYCMSVLPRMTSLQDLSLIDVDLTKGEMPRRCGPSVLRHAHFDRVKFSTANFDAVLGWALGSPQLESMAWSNCSHIKKHIDQAARAMQLCIAAGVRRMSFENCYIDRHGAKVLADALAGTHAREPFEMDLSRNTFTALGQSCLTNALVTCTNVTIHLRGEVPQYFSGKDRVHATTIGVTIRCEGLAIFVCSPTPPPLSTSA